MTDQPPRYDSELQMFIEEEHPLDLNRLNFVRWLVDTGRLQGDTPCPTGIPSSLSLLTLSRS